MNMEEMINKYFRPGRLPHIWCPGCGNGVVTGSVVKAIAKLDLSKDDVAVISGIGCSSRASAILILIPFIPLTAVLFRLQPALNWQSRN